MSGSNPGNTRDLCTFPGFADCCVSAHAEYAHNRAHQG
jgi:hypothetical protein